MQLGRDGDAVRVPLRWAGFNQPSSDSALPFSRSRSFQDLPEGPYLASMRCMHLGNNHFQRFPSALLTAKKVGWRVQRWHAVLYCATLG